MGEKIHSKNTIMFVALHELAHTMTQSIGHTEEFWDNFRFLLKEAIAKGIYKYKNYKEEPEAYCGISITDTPLKDNIPETYRRYRNIRKFLIKNILLFKVWMIVNILN